MTKEILAHLIEQNYSDVISWLEQHSDDKWEKGPEGKWTAGQQTLHLLQSIVPLNNALSLPKFILAFKFGKANRPVRSFEEVKKRYLERLEEFKGGTFKGSKNMKVPLVEDKQYLLDRLLVEQKKLQYKLKKITDKHLDTLVLPHPLMGKMPVREMIMWSVYHVEHHTKTLKDNYS